MVRPNGLMIAATINRTMKSLLLAKIGAEYVLRWLPRGTHRWDKFVTPAELEAAMQKAGLKLADERGVVYRVMADSWVLSDDMDVNYMLTAARGA
jgi:2-polyprenyl-6-hydroxyphenyl methylase/3-demethylubiquinone-9 3-methyltransferase